MKMVNENEETTLTENTEVHAPEEQVSDKFWIVKMTDLITKGKLYPLGTKIFARNLLVPEVKKLSMIMYNPETADFLINETLKKTLKGIDINDLYVADKMYILFMLRASTFKDTAYTVDFKCTKCSEPSCYHFEMSNITANFIADDYNPRQEFELKNGDKITLKYLKVRDNVEIDNLKSAPMFAKNPESLDDEMLNVAASINTINGEKKALVERYSYLVNTIEPEDYSDVQAYINKIEIGIDPYMTVVCQECGGTGQVPVNFLSDFFLPKRKF